MSSQLGKEQRILIAMRKTLTAVARDTAPRPGFRQPLTDRTIEDIRHCLALIAARERELATESGLDVPERPVFADDPQSASRVVPLRSISRAAKPGSASATEPGDDDS